MALLPCGAVGPRSSFLQSGMGLFVYCATGSYGGASSLLRPGRRSWLSACTPPASDGLPWPIAGWLEAVSTPSWRSAASDWDGWMESTSKRREERGCSSPKGTGVGDTSDVGDRQVTRPFVSSRPYARDQASFHKRTLVLHYIVAAVPARAPERSDLSKPTRGRVHLSGESLLGSPRERQSRR